MTNSGLRNLWFRMASGAESRTERSAPTIELHAEPQGGPSGAFGALTTTARETWASFAPEVPGA